MELEEIITKSKDHELELILTDNTRFTAVLIPLVEIDHQQHVLFEVRGHIRQQGEVCFPGGYIEEGETPERCAIRETCEELLVDPQQINIIAPMYRCANRGNIVIDSYLGTIADYKGTYSQDEVETIFTIPLDELLNMEPDIKFANMKLEEDSDLPYELIPQGRNYRFFTNQKRFIFYQYDGHVIWGLTAEILYSFIQFLKR